MASRRGFLGSLTAGVSGLLGFQNSRVSQLGYAILPSWGKDSEKPIFDKYVRTIIDPDVTEAEMRPHLYIRETDELFVKRRDGKTYGTGIGYDRMTDTLYDLHQGTAA